MTINVFLTILCSDPDGSAFPLLLQPSYYLLSPYRSTFIKTDPTRQHPIPPLRLTLNYNYLQPIR